MAGWSCVSVLLLARLTTCRRSSGGKAPGPAGAGGVLEARQTLSNEAFPPLADGVPVAIQLLGELLVGGIVSGRGVQDEATAERQGLGSGTGADQGLEVLAEFRRQDDTRAKGTRHDLPPCTQGDNDCVRGVIMARLGTFVQTLAANL